MVKFYLKIALIKKKFTNFKEELAFLQKYKKTTSLQQVTGAEIQNLVLKRILFLEKDHLSYNIFWKKIPSFQIIQERSYFSSILLERPSFL